MIENSEITNSTVVGVYPRSEPIYISDCEINNSEIISDSYNHGIFISEGEINDTDLRIGCCGANINLDSVLGNNINVTRGISSSQSGSFKLENSTISELAINISNLDLVMINSDVLNKKSTLLCQQIDMISSMLIGDNITDELSMVRGNY